MGANAITVTAERQRNRPAEDKQPSSVKLVTSIRERRCVDLPFGVGNPNKGPSLALSAPKLCF